MHRRTLLKLGLIQAAATGLVFPRPVKAGYPSEAFRAKEASEALRELYGSADIAGSDKIEIEIPAVAAGEMVPVRISSGFDKTESIAVIVESNPSPFTAYFRLYEPQAYVSTRIRIADSGELLVVVKADGQLHTRRHPVRVGNMCRA